MVAFAMKAAWAHLPSTDVSSVARAVGIPALLSLAVIPLTYILSLASSYETLRMRCDSLLKDRGVGGYAARKIVWRCRFSPRKIAQFSRIYLTSFVIARSRADVDVIIEHSRRSRRGRMVQPYRDEVAAD
jgi:hypothetical protein